MQVRRNGAGKELLYGLKKDPPTSKCCVRNCFNKPINSHTISKSQHLGRISDNKRQVLTLNMKHIDPDPAELIPAKIGWKRASTFTGFCNEHDKIFLPLESGKIKPSKLNCILSGYRAVSHEIYSKYKQKCVAKKQMQFDESYNNGHNRDAIIDYMKKIEASLHCLQYLSDMYIKATSAHKYSYHVCQFLKFSGRLSVFSSGIFNPDFCANGKRIQDITKISGVGHVLTFTTLYDPILDENYIFISYLRKHDKMDLFMDSLKKLNEEDLRKFIIFIQFYLLENTFFSSEWWDNLSMNDQQIIKNAAPESPTPDKDYSLYKSLSGEIVDYHSFKWC